VGAGDIALCGSPGAEATARLLDRIAGDVFTAGDNAYPDGSPNDFKDCYEPTWGRHKNRTHSTPGNHDYHQPNATAYFNYFPGSAGPDGLGYYSYNVGSWTVFALNSEINARIGSTQYQWLRGELTATASSPCTVAIWHRPLFTSGPNLDNPQMRDVFRLLYDFKADIVINGHDHFYERFAPQDADGRADAARGIRQFIVGTGGVFPFYSPVTVKPNSQIIRNQEYGVLKLTVSDTSYAWEFITPGGVRDSGTGACH